MTEFEFTKVVIWTWFCGFISGLIPIVIAVIIMEVLNKAGNNDR